MKLLDFVDREPSWERIDESFFSDNHDVLMPIIRGMMKTGLRPLIYKLWTKSPNAVKVLAALVKLRDEGHDDPIGEVITLANLDVPRRWLVRLAQDHGLDDLAGARLVRGQKQNLLPSVASEAVNEAKDDTQTVYHITADENLDDIMKSGLKPMIGQNSEDFGETKKAIHVFLDMNSLEDAVMNWDISWSDPDSNQDFTILTMEIPKNLIDTPYSDYNSGTGAVYQKIPASMVVNRKQL